MTCIQHMTFLLIVYYIPFFFDSDSASKKHLYPSQDSYLRYNEIIFRKTYKIISKSDGHPMKKCYATLKRNVFSEFQCKAYTRSLLEPKDPTIPLSQRPSQEAGGRSQEAGGHLKEQEQEGQGHGRGRGRGAVTEVLGAIAELLFLLGSVFVSVTPFEVRLLCRTSPAGYDAF